MMGVTCFFNLLLLKGYEEDRDADQSLANHELSRSREENEGPRPSQTILVSSSDRTRVRGCYGSNFGRLTQGLVVT